MRIIYIRLYILESLFSSHGSMERAVVNQICSVYINISAIYFFQILWAKLQNNIYSEKHLPFLHIEIVSMKFCRT